MELNNSNGYLAWKHQQSPEGKRSPGRPDQTDFLPQEGNLRGEAAGHYCTPKDKLEQKTALFEQRALAGTQGKKGSLSPLKEGVGNTGRLQGGHDVI